MENKSIFLVEHSFAKKKHLIDVFKPRFTVIFPCNEFLMRNLGLI